ncbi:hypothetical protein SPHINGOAX6_50438 [Sphingomonas sp. AX6]|nr:hypothetical protein SPHINGOAX6_50438 [Sphingomonas sp. AX6]
MGQRRCTMRIDWPLPDLLQRAGSEYQGLYGCRNAAQGPTDHESRCCAGRRERCGDATPPAG